MVKLFIRSSKAVTPVAGGIEEKKGWRRILPSFRTNKIKSKTSLSTLQQEEQLYRNTYIDSNFVRNLEDDLMTSSSCSYLSNRTLSLLSEAGKGSKSMSFESNKSDPKKLEDEWLIEASPSVPSVASKVSTVLGDISIFFRNDYDDGSTVGDESYISYETYDSSYDDDDDNINNGMLCGGCNCFGHVNGGSTVGGGGTPTL